MFIVVFYILTFSLSFAFFGQSNDEIPTTSFSRMLSEVVEPNKKDGKRSLRKLEEEFNAGLFSIY